MSTATRPGRALAWWQLLRAANVFTAASNVIAGFLIVRGEWTPAKTLALLIGSSACLYLAGMVLNDVYDAELDALERPERPIPAGHISRTTASSAGWALLTSGVLLAWLAAVTAGNPMPGLLAVLLAFAIVRYDKVLKSTWAGPMAMGWCRVLNVLLGASIAGDLLRQPWALAYAVLIGMYTVMITIVARSETIGEWSQKLHVRNVVTRMLQGFIVLDAAAATLAAGWPSGLAVLALLVPTVFIARRAPMT
ncbi:MAG TPA: UbiA family prenyltransferase [Lacipirellula sp.]